ncbi:FAD-dependent oxidoreductase [Holosporaceae bacterium 'Namur']|nr:FAD-dependent oxidoreductase [Holosporaceae bacterium 'Namur']
MLNPSFKLEFKDLYSPNKLPLLDKRFLGYVIAFDDKLYHQLMLARSLSLSAKEESDLIISLAPYLEDFIAELFQIKDEVISLANLHHELAPIFWCKRQFIQRKVAKNTNEFDIAHLEQAKFNLEQWGVDLYNELSFAKFVQDATESLEEEKLNYAKIYAAWALTSEEGKRIYKEGVLFKTPKKLVLSHLIEAEKNEAGVYKYRSENVRKREGFDLTDNALNLVNALDHTNYCIWCHNQGKDSCSHGIKDKATNKFAVSELGVNLTGCPLEEKISEMNTLKAKGIIIGALATAMIDNPLLAATGHRICNDCMKSCIYQKQEPVNIPLIETKTLDDVLALPYGFEIYSLLSRWNPLHFKNYLPKEIGNYKVLVAGMGPAGFTLAHYLLNEGFLVTGIDGLKIEPLNAEVSGIDLDGNRIEFKPIKDVNELYSSLSERVPQGFGGVAEYGITVRWNKNYLTLIRLLLERRENFRMYGGIRFGGTITYETAFNLGFDHIALALGAGKPNIPPIPNALAKGVRTASDFLMSLQLTGAQRTNSIANLQVRLPVVVIGGGLTAVDTATESLAYYQVQVEKFLKSYEKLGEEIFDNFNNEEKEVAFEYIEHAKKLRDAAGDERIKLLRAWGGVKVAYRKTLQEAPSYRLNSEEAEKAFEEGIEFAENIIPEEILIDNSGCCIGLRHSNGVLDAKTILIAVGTEPNTVLAGEDEEHFKLDGRYFTALDENFNITQPERIAKPEKPYVLSSLNNKNKAVSFFGDLHPSYVGNVVKAMASAKQGYRVVSEIIRRFEPLNDLSGEQFFKKLDDNLIVKVKEVKELAPNIIEIIFKARSASAEFQPGQFYRLQNYEANALVRDGVSLAMEGLALTGAWVDKEQGLISTIVLEMGGSSNLCRYLKEGENVVLMGPTGTPTEIPENETIMLVGGGLGNAVLFSIGKAMKEKGCRVLYFAGYRKKADRYKVEEIEKASDVTVWCCDEGLLSYSRKNDKAFNGNIIQAIKAYGEKSLGAVEISLEEVDRIIVIGSDKMMAAVAYARHNILKSFLKGDHIAIGSINSPMQCMMKEICAQCLQRHVDPVTQKDYYVFSCFNQDQLLDEVDFNHLNLRLNQNSLQEKVCAKLIKQLLVV